MPIPPLLILIVCDTQAYYEHVSQALLRGRKHVSTRMVTSLPDLHAALESRPEEAPWDLVISPYRLKAFNALDILALGRQFGLDIALLVVDAPISPEEAANLLRMGGIDFLSLDLIDRLPHVVAAALVEAKTRQEQKADRLLLSKDRAMLQTLLESTPDLLYFKDTNGSFLRVNRNKAERHGYHDPTALIGKTDYHLYPQAVAQERWQIEQDVMHTGYPQVGMEEREVLPDGREVWTSFSQIPLLDTEGRVMGIFGIARDITNRKHSDDALRRRDAILDAVTFSAERFLRSQAWTDHIRLVLERLGQATKAACILIFERHQDNQGSPVAALVHEWLGHGFQAHLDYLALQQVNLSEGSFAQWWETLGRGSIIRSHSRNTPSDILHLLGLDGSEVSLLAVPIPTEQETWGFVLLVEPIQERDWFDPEIDALKAAGSILGAAIQRGKMEHALHSSEERFARIFDISPMPIVITRLSDSKIIDINLGFQEVMGYGREEIIGKSGFEIGLWVDAAERAQMLESLYKPRSNRGMEMQIRTRTGDVRTVLVSIELIEIEGDICILWTANDITTSKAAENALRRREEELRDANLKLQLWVDELERRNREINMLNEMGDMLQTCRAEEEAYAVVGEFAQRLFPNQAGALYVFHNVHALVEAVAAWGDPPPRELVFTPDACWGLRRGQVHLVENTAAGLCCQHLNPKETGIGVASLCIPMNAQGESLGMLHLQGALKTSTDRWREFAVTVSEHIALALANLKLRDSLRLQSFRDPLTGLYNRRYLDNLLERELRRAARHQREISLMIMDIDAFRQFNDSYGRDAGDMLLRELGAFLQSKVRTEDVFCRLRDDEFVVVMPEMQPQEACQRAGQILLEARRFEIYHQDRALGGITFSIGISAFPQHGETIDDLLRMAEKALMRARADGCNCVRLVDAQDAA
ncbi:MAG TPA: diguanylate cyclase [Anaerolineaceae bacterium]